MDKRQLHQICCCLLLLIATTKCYNEDDAGKKVLKGVYSWKVLEFKFATNRDKELAIGSGYYKPGASIPIDVDVYYGTNDRKVFVTMPRLERGVPMTVGYVSDIISESGNPLIAPYPNWEWNKLDNDCDAIISVYRIQVDECDRIWILDTGVIGEERVCPPQILSFSLQTNKLLSRYRFPRNQYKEHSLFVTPMVDVRSLDNHCRDTFVYIADVTVFSLVVYDHQNVRSWHIYNNLFYPYPPYGTFEIKKEVFDLMDGILGLALSPLRWHEDRILYFHSLASRIESYVPTSVIRNFTLFNNAPYAAPRSFKAFDLERSSQSAAETMDRDGVLFFGLMSDLAIGCWNSKHFPEFGGRNIETLIIDEDTLQFASGLKVKSSKTNRQEIWVSTAAFQRYMSGTLHSNETNFRIQAAFVDELVRGTKCDVRALDNYSQSSSNRLSSSPRPTLEVGSNEFRFTHVDSSLTFVGKYSLVMRFVLCIFALVGVASAYYNSVHQYSPLTTEYEWTYFDYLWDSQHEKIHYVRWGLYNYTKMTPIDVERSIDGRTFVTIIRTAGVPATLHTVSNQKGESGPLLKPYPDWSWYSNLQCDKIINVYRVAIDECNRMWVLDTGTIDDSYPCPAKLLVFNLYNDQLLFTHEIPNHVARNKNGEGLLITPIVETFGFRCANSTVYMADTTGYGMVIYNGQRTYRLEAEEFRAEIKYSNFTIADESFFLPDGLFGMALTPLLQNTRERFLAFRPLASTSLYGASTEVLKRSTQGNTIRYLKGHHVLPNQATAMAFSSGGTLFYALTGETAIGCWNADKPLEPRFFKVAIRDPTRLQFASGLKVIKNPLNPTHGEYLLVMTNRLQKIYSGTINFKEINFRITKAVVKDVISGTVCDRY
ncbi:uncharacterized protein LOC131674122 [Phymastichus coffea]|uniref:uncharacterized protein LOC131674122 n=1 Tax=Phymastichus coffea TaxID=108790 RepID=UPI00273BD550|nr:uncharacterized protein LOC131674122 [Phymastichus coffea]